jgi:carboxymethylenebutenolidase
MAIETSTLTLRTTDEHDVSCYCAAPSGTPVGGLVLLHEIFGVNQHIREVADSYAAEGFLSIAPALFDRAERGVELDYSKESAERGRALREKVGWRGPLLDIQAAINAAQDAGSVAVMGYCWGGSLSFLAAARLIGLSCAVGYYGAQTVPFASEEVHVPVMLHFGELDPRIPSEDIETIHAGNPDIEMHTFPADHGFNCDHRKEYHAESAQRARALTLAFLRKHLAG